MASRLIASPLARKLSHCRGRGKGGALSLGVGHINGGSVLVKWLPHLVDPVQRVLEVPIPQHHSIEVGELGPHLQWLGQMLNLSQHHSPFSFPLSSPSSLSPSFLLLSFPSSLSSSPITQFQLIYNY